MYSALVYSLDKNLKIISEQVGLLWITVLDDFQEEDKFFKYFWMFAEKRYVD